MSTPRIRRALTHVGGKIETGGDRKAAALLAAALDVPSNEGDDSDPSRAHVHGFHAYPARMHPLTARRLVEQLAAPGKRVLDPFCGSGTVLIEARLAGRESAGTDLNPLAIKLARRKIAPLSPDDGARILAASQTIRQKADERRIARAGATRRLADRDVALFPPHVLLELDSLRAGIEALTAPADAIAKDALYLVLSSLFIKVSQKKSDTSEDAAPRRIAAGYTAKLFFRKTEELVARLGEYAKLLPATAPRTRVELDDATKLATVETASIDAVVTSPPYANTYDYLAHHAVRLRWLGLDERLLEHGELGAKRRYAKMHPDAAEEAWIEELAAFLRAASRVMKAGAPLVMLIGDSAIGARALRADQLVARAAERTRLVPLARATQRRPHFHGPTAKAFSEIPRGEHALMLQRS
ncbi:site-specific DNA-methyltransferase [Pendulispora rubella]|uniref:Methyltransferase n=1 Tax=Pendulispora rubella TaxID=2741070 RepID=A0ABZ2LB94_9BACT